MSIFYSNSASRRAQLIEQAREAFVQRFGPEPEAVGVAPGRVELLGNHTDYNEGFVLTAAIDRGIAIAGCPREVPTARVSSLEQDATATFDPQKPERDPQALWSDYVKGIVDQLNKAGASVGGFDAMIASDIPTGAGVSSSAALLVSTAQLLLNLNPHPVAGDPMALAKLARRAENEFVGAPVGTARPVLLGLRARRERPIPRLPHAGMAGRHPADQAGAYPDRRLGRQARARGGRRLLGATGTVRGGGGMVRGEGADQKYPHTARRDAGDAGGVRPGTRPDLEKRARHIVYENKRVEMGAEALDTDNVGAFGELMSMTHESCMRFFENSCEEVDTLVETAVKHEGVYGRETFRRRLGRLRGRDSPSGSDRRALRRADGRVQSPLRTRTQPATDRSLARARSRSASGRNSLVINND
jgi:galactokinase